MTRNEALKECERVAQDTTLDEMEKRNEIADFIAKNEGEYLKSGVRDFINQLEKSTGINLISAKNWNMLREEQ